MMVLKSFCCNFQIPSSVSHVFWGIQAGTENKSLTWLILNEVGNLFIIINASINIIPYYLFGKRFRTLFVLIYFGWLPACCKRRRGKHESHTYTPPQPLLLSNGRPRLPSRGTSQPLLLSNNSAMPPPPPPATGKRDSSPFIVINLDGAGPFENGFK